jgi:hypothetical protein
MRESVVEHLSHRGIVPEQVAGAHEQVVKLEPARQPPLLCVLEDEAAQSVDKADQHALPDATQQFLP